MGAIGDRHDVTKVKIRCSYSAFISRFDVLEGRQLCATGLRPKKPTISGRERLQTGLSRTILAATGQFGPSTVSNGKLRRASLAHSAIGGLNPCARQPACQPRREPTKRGRSAVPVRPAYTPRRGTKFDSAGLDERPKEAMESSATAKSRPFRQSLAK